MGDSVSWLRRPKGRGWAASWLAAAVVLSSCGGATAPHFQPRLWLSADAARRLVVLSVRVHGDGNSLGDINGFSRGQVLVEIPTGWRVTVRCVNASSVAQSCAIVQGSLSVHPAFAGAATPNPTGGLPPGRSASFSFLASRPGAFRIASLVDDEEIGNGTWDGFEVGGTREPMARLVRRLP